MRTEDRIVYTLIGKGGGVDGMDVHDRGGQLRAASFDRQDLENHPGKPWAEIVPKVVDMVAARRHALAKLDPIDRLVLGLEPK